MEPDWNSPTWLWVVEYLCSVKDKRSEELAASLDRDEMVRLQGDIRTLNQIIKTPTEYLYLKKKGKA